MAIGRPPQSHAPTKDPRLFSPLAGFAGARPPAPAWFERALAVRAAAHDRAGRGRRHRDARLGRGRAARPASAARQRRTCRLVADDRAVLRADPPGRRALVVRHGRSQWRKTYTLEHFVAEVMAVGDATGLFAGPRKPVAVGHSFGSFPLVETGRRHGDRFSGLVIVDSPFSTPERREERRQRARREAAPAQRDAAAQCLSLVRGGAGALPPRAARSIATISTSST